MARRVGWTETAWRVSRILAGVCLVLLLLFAVGFVVMIRMPGKSHLGPLPEMTEHERVLVDALRRDVEELAGEIGVRNLSEYPKLRAAEELIASSLTAAGHEVRRQEYRVDGRACQQRGDRIMGMLALEMLGYYSDAEASQGYPFPLSLFYPSKGDFIGFVGDVSSRGLVREVIASFRGHARFPSEGVAIFGALPGIGYSDHWSFWQIGVPAIMVTDTAFFRNHNYHQPTDTPDTLDYDRMARVVAGLEKVIADLAGPARGPVSVER